MSWYGTGRDPVGLTREFMAPFGAEAERVEAYRGSLLPVLERVSQEFAERFEAHYGEPLRPTLDRREYLMTREEKSADYRLIERMKHRGTLPGQTAVTADMPNDIPGWIRRSQQTLAAHEIGVGRDLLSAQCLPPGVLYEPPIIQQRGNVVNCEGSVGAYDCMTTVFGMMAVGLSQKIRPDQFVSNIASREAQRRTGDEYICYDLPGMVSRLNSVIDPAVSTRCIATAGAPLEEIRDKLIMPIHQRHPGIKFGIGLVTQSDIVVAANHAYTVLSVDDEPDIRLGDPKYTVARHLSKTELSFRWLATNLSAVVVLVNDRRPRDPV